VAANAGKGELEGTDVGPSPEAVGAPLIKRQARAGIRHING